MKLNELLNELRASPQLNTKSSGVKSTVDYLKSLRSLDNIGISMTSIPKLGLNPQSKYNTPIGVYFYPAEYYLKMKNADLKLPFQDDAPYIQVLEYAGIGSNLVLDLPYHTSSDLATDMEKLESSIPHMIAAFDMSVTPRDFRQALLDEREDSYNLAKVKSPGGQLWYMLYTLSHEYIPKHGGGSRPPIIWNSLLRMLGYSAVVDDKAIIHTSEPVQGVVVDMRSYKHIKTYANTASGVDPKDSPSAMILAKLVKAQVDLHYIHLFSKHLQQIIEAIIDDNSDARVKAILTKVLDYLNKPGVVDKLSDEDRYQISRSFRGLVSLGYKIRNLLKPSEIEGLLIKLQQFNSTSVET